MSGPSDFGGERVFIGLGGNLGNPRRAMAEALQALHETPGIEVIRVSSLFRTPPWGKTDQPDFLNAVAELRCGIEPEALLAACLAIERSLKRERAERWGPRIIDIDIIAFGERQISKRGLQVPHPRWSERAFVLMPLVEIAPDFRIGGVTAAQMLAGLDCSGISVEAGGEDWLLK